MTDGDCSADDLSKSEEISVNNRSIPDIIESPNFTDTYNAWRKSILCKLICERPSF
ncbi:hypothetical protein BDFB_004991 [Asbolus verrucosus]|uniref:Uncharacterized protein n=1 Tax=Asbolus verrucosus TaxID=1661398 RepID=A0A482VBH0_ASBVE|nr:hypothetical protein BDFB_004991 [Asbolus verrucosus]